MLEGQEATGVERHQHLGTLHDVQAEGPGTDDQPLLPRRSQRQHYAVIVLRHQRQTGHRGEQRQTRERGWRRRADREKKVEEKTLEVLEYKLQYMSIMKQWVLLCSEVGSEMLSCSEVGSEILLC